jgi:hypothetical protein
MGATDAASGALKPVVVFSSASNAPTLLEIGDSGTQLAWHGKNGSPMIQIGQDPITVERLGNGGLALSTAIRDAGGRMIAELNRNEWKVRPSLLWDRNFNTEAVEVRGESGDSVLQVRVLPDRIQLQGIWHTSTGNFFELVKSPYPQRPGGLAIFRSDQQIKIKPIFLYPSDQHPGELLPH